MMALLKKQLRKLALTLDTHVDQLLQLTSLTYRRVVVRSGTSDDFSLRFFSKPSEPTKIKNQELIDNP